MPGTQEVKGTRDAWWKFPHKPSCIAPHARYSIQLCFSQWDQVGQIDEQAPVVSVHQLHLLEEVIEEAEQFAPTALQHCVPLAAESSWQLMLVFQCTTSPTIMRGMLITVLKSMPAASRPSAVMLSTWDNH